MKLVTVAALAILGLSACATQPRGPLPKYETRQITSSQCTSMRMKAADRTVVTSTGNYRNGGDFQFEWNGVKVTLQCRYDRPSMMVMERLD